MAFADMTAYKSAIASPQEIVGAVLPSLGTGSATNTPVLCSGWLASGVPGVAPTTAVVPDRTTTGALGQQNGGSNQLFVTSAEASASRSITGGAEVSGVFILADRLSHQGGLSGTSLSTQTTNLPTAALTRYTSGAGVWAALEVYSAVGSTTLATVTASYTNQAGTSGQSGVASLGSFNSYAARAVNQMTVMALAAGDTGVRSVESVTLSASTGTAGNFGVTLFKPLLFLPMGVADQYQYDVTRGTLGGGLPEIIDNACLFWLWVVAPVSASSQRAVAALNFSEA